MYTLKHTGTFNKLILLIAIFLIGFISLFSLNQVFTNIIGKLDQQTENLKAQIIIGEFIALDIVTIRSLFNELATTTNSKKSRQITYGEIKKNISTIEDSLVVLEHGGTLKRMIALNIAGHLSTVKTIHYIKEENKSFSIEAIDIRPKLKDINTMLLEVEKFLSQETIYKNSNEITNYQNLDRKLHRYYKALPAFFNRMTENIRRLLYESGLELSELERKIEKDKEKYFQLKIALILIIITIVLFLGYTIAKNIGTSNKELSRLNEDLLNNLHELDKQKKSIRAILDTQPSIVIVSDGLHIQDANQKFFEFLAEFNTIEEFKKQYNCICDLFEDDIPNDEEYIQNKQYNEQQWFEYIISNPDINFKAIIINNKKAHHFSIKVSKTLLDEVSNESVVIISLNDITQEIEDQLQLKKLNENLENIVDEKTKELKELNENLEQKIIIESGKVQEKNNIMMQQAKLASMGEMIGNIAHQWRQPLSVISSSASGMQMQSELGLEITNEEINELSSLIVQQAQYLSHTIDHFRDFIKDDNTSFGPISIRKTVENTLKLVDATLKANHIQLIASIDDDLSIEGNLNELTQAFINIINNSKDALKENVEKEDERYIFVSTRKVNDSTLEIQIKDTGGGIPNDIIDRIFEPYFTSKHQSMGTGLGLAMVDKIIRQRHQGSLKANNIIVSHNDKTYKGTCISIVFSN